MVEYVGLIKSVLVTDFNPYDLGLEDHPTLDTPPLAIFEGIFF